MEISVGLIDSLDQIEVVAQGPPHSSLIFHHPQRARVQQNRVELERLLLDHPDIPFYGINTGFADNRNKVISPEARSQLQENLIKSHCAGAGDPLPAEVVRVVLALRANSLAHGSSGIRPIVIEKLCELYNSGVVPFIPEFGSVGASGDLAPLSHLALVLLGEGQIVTPDGIREFSEVDTFFDPIPISEGGFRLHSKEGLALNNGTTIIAAFLSLAMIETRRLLKVVDALAAFSAEAVCGCRDAFLPQVHALRPHPGVSESAEAILRYLEGSTWIRSGFRTTRLDFDRESPDKLRLGDPQDDYCIRCAPQAHGAARQAFDHVHELLRTEFRAVTDNPLIIESAESALEVHSAGHFHGMPLAMAADYLRNAITCLASISERRIAKLVDGKRNEGLSNYLVAGDAGLKSGFMIAQYSAASIVNQLKATSFPHSADTIPTGNNAEDFVSMGSNAARSTYFAVKLARTVVASEALVVAQAIHLRQEYADERGWRQRCGPTANAFLKCLTQSGLIPWNQDQPVAPAIHAVDQWLHGQPLPNCNRPFDSLLSE